MIKKKEKDSKVFYVEYDLRFSDGINTIKGFMYAPNKDEVFGIINQIAIDLKSDEHIIDVVELADDYDWQEEW